MKCNASVETWTNCISSLPDGRFFDIMRLYLGEIETPYNKQRLIEQLAGFVKNEANSASMIALLDEYDIKILTALAFIPNATQETLIEFFAQEYTMADILTELSNLISRLLVFEQKDEYSSKKYLRINPLVWDKLEPFIQLSNIISPAEVAKTNIDDCFSLTPDFLAAFISFINTKYCSCKSDGVMKKNTLTKVQSIFKGQEKTIQLILNGFINLNLVREGERTLVIDNERFALFAGLEQSQQYALLCAACCSRFSREGLKKEAQLLLDTLCSIPEQGFTLASLVRLGFLAGTQATAAGPTGSSKSRFSRMLEAARQENAGAMLDPEQAGSLLDRMLDSAVQLGLLKKTGWDSQGHEVFICSDSMKQAEKSEPLKNVLNIDSTFTVSLMPGLSLKKLLPLTEFLEIKSVGVVTEYEISRQSVSAAFDRGWTVETLCTELEKYTSYDLPQNLKVCISEWYDSYSSAMLYKGYVLKVAKNNISFVENAPNIKKHIKEKLAEGIYLLNIPVDSEITTFVEESGLDFMGKVKDSFVPGEKLAFPLLRTPSSASGVPEPVEGVEGPRSRINFSAASHLLQSLKQELKNLDLTKNQRECLENRIHNRLILTKEQLATTSVRSEILEADGMDFGGKLHLFEAGLKENDMMELTLPQFDKEDEYFKVVGRTLGITKQTGDAVVRFEVYPTHEITNFVVSRITYLRRLRF